MKYLLLVVAILSLPCSAYAACTVVQNSDNGSIMTQGPGQSWTAPCDGVLSSIKVSAPYAQAGPYTLSVLSGESLDPGDVLAQAPNIALADGENTISIPSMVNVSTGQLYTFQFSSGVLTSLLGQEGGIYPGGRMCNSVAFNDNDLWFEVEIVDKSSTGGSDSGCFISTLVDH